MTDTLRLPWADAVRDPDAALLARYAADRDAAAFAVLVHRHGPTVFGVCLRNAGHRADAEDAFQAVFLLLARQAGTLRQPELLGHWLFGVAYRVARKARRAVTRRRTHEAKGAAVPRPEPRDSDWADVAPVLDDELMRLAEHHRAAVVLCDVQGLSRTDAAERLGIPEGTLSSRLNAARKKLADRLAKRGVTLSVGVLATHATAAMSEELSSRLAKALTVFHSDGLLPAPLSELITEGVLPMRTKLLALVAAFGLGSVGVLAAWPADEPKPQADAKAKADPPKAEQPKAEPPKEDFNRPPRDKRLRMVGSFEADVRLERPFWSADGKAVLTWTPTPDGIGPKDAPPHRKEFQDIGVRLTAWALPSGVVGLCEKGGTYVAFTQGSGINGVSLLTGWDFDELTRGTAKKTWETELEKEDGHPLAISPDGKRLFTQPLPGAKAVGGGRSHVRLLDARTGNPLREVVTSTDDKSAPVHIAFSVDTSRVFLAHGAAKGFTLRAVDTADGKQVWERTVEGVFLPERAQNWKMLANGGLLAVTVSGTEEPDATNLLRLFDTATGKDGATLLEPGNHGGLARAISPDGRFLVGIAEDHESVEAPPGGFGGGGGFQPGGGGGFQPKKGGNPRPGGVGGAGGFGQPGGGWGGRPVSVRARYSLVAWDTATGKRVRSWPYDGSEPDVAFAPDRPLLAVSDHRHIYQDKGQRIASTLGFWDFSGLTK